MVLPGTLRSKSVRILHKPLYLTHALSERTANISQLSSSNPRTSQQVLLSYSRCDRLVYGWIPIPIQGAAKAKENLNQDPSDLHKSTSLACNLIQTFRVVDDNDGDVSIDHLRVSVPLGNSPCVSSSRAWSLIHESDVSQRNRQETGNVHLRDFTLNGARYAVTPKRKIRMGVIWFRRPTGGEMLPFGGERFFNRVCPRSSSR